MNQTNRGDIQRIIYIMLNGIPLPYPTLPPTLFFSVNNLMHPSCPPIF